MSGNPASLASYRTTAKMGGNKWDEVVDKLTMELGSKLRMVTRNEIIKFCVENKTTRQAAENFLKKYQKSDGKCSVRGKEKLIEGDRKSYKGLQEESISLYTESIFSCTKSDELLATAYIKRAQALLSEFHPDCISDIDMALDMLKDEPDLPEPLVQMKVVTLCKTEGKEKAIEFLENYVKKYHNKEEYDLMMKFIGLGVIKEERIELYKGLPQLAGGENEDFVSASKYLSIHFNKKKGRHVVATENIEPGDVLFVEKPFAHILWDKGCQNCFKRKEFPIVCFGCTDVTYCSKKCMDEFERVHAFECGFHRLFKSVGIAHLSLRVVLNASSSFHELQSVSKNIVEPKHNNGVVLYRSKEYDSVYNLVHHSDKHDSLSLFQYAMTALLLTLHLKHNTQYFVGGSPSDDDLEYVASRIWLHILQLICNGHATTRVLETGLNVTQIQWEKEVRCGTSIYPSASMLNHSCDPSIVHSFHHKWLIVRAAKPIKKGEEVFNCYGTHARRMKRAKRQEVLRNQYFFQCRCTECLSSYDIQEVLTALKCTKCKGPAVRKADNSQSTICLECGLSGDIPSEVSNKYDRFYALMKTGELLRSENFTSHLKIFHESWLLGREIFYKFHIDLAYAAKEVARCLACCRPKKEELRTCIAFLRCCARSVEVRFGTCSLEYANELKTLCDVIAFYGSAFFPDRYTYSYRYLMQEGLAIINKAMPIVNLLCGPESEEYDEMKMTRDKVVIYEDVCRFQQVNVYKNSISQL